MTLQWNPCVGDLGPLCGNLRLRVCEKNASDPARRLLDRLGYHVALEESHKRRTPPQLLLASTNEFALEYHTRAGDDDRLRYYPVVTSKPYDSRFRKAHVVALPWLFRRGRSLDVFDGVESYMRGHHRDRITQWRLLNFDYQSERVAVRVEYQPILAAYFVSLPPFDPVTESGYPSETLRFDHQTRNTLRKSLAARIDISNEQELIRFVMHMTRSAFQYLEDDTYVGYERAVPPQGMLLESVEYSDCDDKALFAAAVLRELGFHTAILDYPDHQMTGVRMNDQIHLRRILGYVPLEVAGDGYPMGEVYPDLENVVPAAYSLP